MLISLSDQCVCESEVRWLMTGISPFICRMIKNEEYGPNCPGDEFGSTSDGYPPAGILSPDSIMDSSGNPSLHMSGIHPSVPSFKHPTLD